ncbi:hypothetical protein DFH09DRAFT_1281139 [Mycena vulgaris]|nr:hypothetical protein DFH09DRAFT_1281139 [Mycena vulgaris]
MLLPHKTRDSDSSRQPWYWGQAFHEQEPALGGARQILDTPSFEYPRNAPSPTASSIPRTEGPPLCPIASAIASAMPIPTSLSNESSGSTARQVTLVAVTTGGAILAVFLVFALIFFRVRSKQRQQELTDTLAREERKGKGAGGMGMLDGEGFESVRGRQVEYRRPQITYHLQLPSDLERGPQYPAEPTLRYPTLPPFLFPPRASDSGSAFREEVWPPPRQESVFVDPLLQAPADDLSRIVIDIMGPNGNARVDSSASLPTYSPFSGAASPRSRRNSCSTIYAATALRSYASTPTLPLSTLSADSRGTDSDDDPLWPPTPGRMPGNTPPVSFWQRPGAPLLGTTTPPFLVSKTATPLFRPSTGDGSPRVKNWLERTPRRVDSAPDYVPRRAASVGH